MTKNVNKLTKHQAAARERLRSVLANYDLLDLTLTPAACICAEDDGAIVRPARGMTAADRARLPEDTRQALARLRAGEIRPLSMVGRL